MEPEQTPVAQQECEAFAALARRLAANIANAVQVRPETLTHLMVALLAEGHVLIEDYPGVGKTALARALARSIDCQFARVQCTSDLLPADVVGTNVYDQREPRFEFRPGPVFANVVLVDEINRASPKTQSGLLECMQERRVTVDVHTHELARPFVVLATQNPIEYEGTYPLPEAQVDRFMIRISLGYPSRDAEAGMLADHEAGDRVLTLTPVATAAEVLAAQDAATRVRASEPLRDYVVRVLWRTREDPRVDLGASPRAGLLLLRAAKAYAMMQGRDHALPDDVQALAQPVLAHRLVLAPESSRRRPRTSSATRSRRCERCEHRQRLRSTAGRGGACAVKRAAAVAVAGLALILVALLFDAAPLFVPGVAITLLGVVAPAWVVLAAHGASIERTLDSQRVVEEEPIEATIEVRRGHWGLPGAAVVDPLVGESVSIRTSMSIVSGGTSASVRIVASFPRRGMRRIDPPMLIVSDALDLARIVRESPSPAQELLVLPRTERVKWVPGAGEKWRRATGAAPLEPFGATEVDGLRPYRQGTPASRIHWAALARGAGLLERRLRADTETRPLVVLDARVTDRSSISTRRSGPRPRSCSSSDGAPVAACCCPASSARSRSSPT